MFVPLMTILAWAGAPLAPIGQQEMRSTVTVSRPCADDCPDGNITFGAGEIVDRRPDGTLVVVTARHVVEDSKALEVFVRNGATPGIGFDAFAQTGLAHRATLIAYAANVDLALVAFAPTGRDDYTLAPIATDDIKAAPVPGVVIGDPNGSLWTVSPYTFLESQATTFDFDCHTCGPGDSGGGVFNANGELLGIVVQQRVEDEDETERTSEFQAISLAELRMFLNIAGTGRSLTWDSAAPLSSAWKRFDALREAP
jgi:S1-C subfamily serine protease